MAVSSSTIKKGTRISLIFIVTLSLTAFSYLFSNIIILLIISLLIAMILDPLVKLFENNSISRLSSVLLVFLLSAITIFIGLYFLIPKILGQMNAIADALSKERIDAIISQIEESVKGTIPFIQPAEIATKLSEFISQLLFNSINNISNIVSSIVSVVAISVIVPFMTFFILKDNNQLIKATVNIMPNKYFEMTYLVIHKIKIQLGRFVRGWLLDAIIVGVLSAVGLSILGIKNAITIGFIAGIGHLIPYFGPLVGGLPAIIISVIQFGNLSMLPGIIIMFLIVYAIDNGFIQPNVFSKSTDMHPLMIIVLILAGSELMGLLGMLLAVPSATIIKTATREIYFGYKNHKILKVT